MELLTVSSQVDWLYYSMLHGCSGPGIQLPGPAVRHPGIRQARLTDHTRLHLKHRRNNAHSVSVLPPFSLLIKELISERFAPSAAHLTILHIPGSVCGSKWFQNVIHLSLVKAILRSQPSLDLIVCLFSGTSGVGISFIFSWVLMGLVTIIFLAGGNMEKLVCEPFHTKEVFKASHSPFLPFTSEIPQTKLKINKPLNEPQCLRTFRDPLSSSRYSHHSKLFFTSCVWPVSSWIWSQLILLWFSRL